MALALREQVLAVAESLVGANDVSVDMIVTPVQHAAVISPPPYGAVRRHAYNKYAPHYFHSTSMTMEGYIGERYRWTNPCTTSHQTM